MHRLTLEHIPECQKLNILPPITNTEMRQYIRRPTLLDGGDPTW